MREWVCYNQFYQTFNDVKEKISAFFDNIHLYKNFLQSRINDNFQVFKLNIIKLAV
jgi:hypothetical protein